MKYEKPSFQPGDFSERSLELFTDNASWERTNRLNHGHSRAVTFTEWPNRYWVSQYGTEKGMIRKSVEHVLFEVALMSALRTEDGLRDFKRWYIIPSAQRPETVYCIQNVIYATPEEEAAQGDSSRSSRFALEQGLAAPNEEDLIQLGMILDLGSYAVIES